MTTGKTIALTRWTFVDKVMSLLFNMLFRLVTTFLPRSKHLLISWLLSPSAVILLLNHFSCVRLCVTPQTAAHQASLSLGFSRQEHWSGLPFPSPMHESEKWKWSRSVMPYSLCKPMDCSPPGSSVHGIFLARVPEWGAIAFSWFSTTRLFIVIQFI